MKIVLLGSPGVGKGTYGTRMARHYGIPIISTGELFRQQVADRTGIGLKAKEYMDRGDYVPDKVVLGMLKERVSQDDCSNGFFLDGFPRTMEQVKALEAMVNLDMVVNFVATDEVILHRLTHRLVCRNCATIFHKIEMPPKVEGVCDKCGGELYTRDDDKPEAVKERLRVYHEKTAPLIKYYTEKGILKKVDANGYYKTVIGETIALIDRTLGKGSQ
jgi:adenylate kinase